MIDSNPILIDSFGRKHDYLRISLTDHCNLRCFYCMPEDGIEFQEKDSYLRTEEVIAIATHFVQLGVRKIRLTGGEPLVRKDFETIVRALSKLNVELAITTNGVYLDRYIELFDEVGLKNINVSLDSLDEVKNQLITKRNFYKQVRDNITMLLARNVVPKLNVVIMKNINDNEIIDFVELAKHSKVDVRFLEFMPFNGNKWEQKKCFSEKEIMDKINNHYGITNIEKLIDKKHSTSRAYTVKNYLGSFGVISSITHPFCGECNRIRLTADGQLKNCLFSATEFDLRTSFRAQQDINPVISACIQNKKAVRAGLSFTDNNLSELENNRSMITIGG